jgi:hypothetical protein
MSFECLLKGYVSSKNDHFIHISYFYVYVEPLMIGHNYLAPIVSDGSEHII